MEEIKTISYYNSREELDIEKLVNDYSGYIYTIIKNMVNDLLSEEDKEEIISDVLFAVWKNREKIDEAMPLKPYIAGITKNIVKNALRKKNNKVVLIDNEEQEKYISSTINIEEMYETSETIRILEQKLNQLGKENIKIFKMYYYNNMKAKEIAQKLNITEDNVTIKLHRTRKKLKKELEKCK